MLPRKHRCMLCKSNNNLHSFPKDENRKRAWVEAIGLRMEDIHYRDKICDLHFTPNQYLSRTSKRLKEDASPSLFSSSALESEVNNEGILVKTRPRRCVLCRSTNSYLHEFPKDESQKRAWVEAIGLRMEDIRCRDRICDLHFTPNQYLSRTSKRLKEDASPSLFSSSALESESNNEGILVKTRPRRCVLCRSTNSYLHEFPKDESRKRAWVQAIGLRMEDIRCRDRICDLHFTPNQHKSGGASKRLKEDASPSLFLYPTAEVESMTLNTNESNTFSEARTVASTSQLDLNDNASPSLFSHTSEEFESMTVNTNESNTFSEARTVASTSHLGLNDDVSPSSFVKCTITEVESLPEGANESNSCSIHKLEIKHFGIMEVKKYHMYQLLLQTVQVQRVKNHKHSLRLKGTFDILVISKKMMYKLREER